ncbi:MAG: branched-chain amino acid ABC transporter permease [Betaproteobacteria bacterium]|nr:MAG: branched-chain amino acid ABC transporter permease [Betaproteobacteria bacterium]
MNLDTVLWLVQDGISNGAIYALLALALLLVFAVTRVIFVPQGEFIAYAALSLTMLQAGQLPGTVYVLVGGGLLAAAYEIAAALRARAGARLPRVLAFYVLLPAAIAVLAWWAAPRKFDLWVQALIVLGLVVPLGPILYRIAYQPLANASVVVLFIVSMAVHYALTGLGLLFFGGEGLRSAAFSDAQFKLGVVNVTAQSVLVVLASVLVMLALWLFFTRSLYGKALRATAVNRVGARLVGIPAELSGSLSFLLAAFIGAVSGVLVAPIATIYYDTGFLIGLKGFVGAILGGMASYPLAALGALAVGLLESFSSFWASAFKETIVFTAIIPVLVWRSLTSRHVEDEEE